MRQTYELLLSEKVLNPMAVPHWPATIQPFYMLIQIPEFTRDAANDGRLQRSRTVPIAESILAVPGYPHKLAVFKMPASKYWQVRCFMRGKTHRRSTKTTSLRQAQRFARWFFEDLLIQAPISKQSHEFESNFQSHSSNPKFAPNNIHKNAVTFGAVAAQVYANEQAREARGELSCGTLRMFRCRLDAHILPRFGAMLVTGISYSDLLGFAQFLSQHLKMSTTSVSNYLITVRKVLQHAQRVGAMLSLPEFPKVKVKVASRGAFTLTEYWLLRRATRQLRGQTHPSGRSVLRENHNLRHAHNIMPNDMDWVIGFMVNSFIRPGDLKKLQHKHVEVVRAEHTYLRLTLPETKLHNGPIVTLYPAVHIYERLCKHHALNGLVRPDDFLFLPEIRDRTYAMQILSVMFNWVLQHTGLKSNAHGKPRTLYSLRHSSITFRLLYGQGIDVLTLARNARTGIDVINTHYASTVTGEQNIALLQSRRTRTS